MDREHEIDSDLEREIGAGIRKVQDQEPPAWLAGAIMDRVAPGRAPRRGFFSRLARPRTVTFSPAALALAASLVLVGFAAGYFSGRDREPADLRAIAEAYPLIRGNAESSFLLGRGLLAAGLNEEAARHFARAVQMEPLQVEYRLWLGKALGDSERTQEEVLQYRLAASLDPYSPGPMHDLADAYMRAGLYEQSAGEYERILSSSPDDSEALFGCARALLRLGRNDRAAAHLKRLLDSGAHGRRGVEAAALLNGMGDYEYRPTVIGRRRTALKSPEFEAGELTAQSRAALTDLAAMLSLGPDTVLHVVAYAEGDMSLARQRSLAVKQAILDSAAGIPADRIRASWFDTAEILDNGASLADSIRIFGVLEKTSKDKGVRT